VDRTKGGEIGSLDMSAIRYKRGITKVASTT
jgi:hypothetical protein